MNQSDSSQNLLVRHPSFRGKVGVARRDITPPLGIYSRMWGSALHDVAEGVHRPLTATVMTFESSQGPSPMILASLDLGWWRSDQDEWFLRGAAIETLGLGEHQLLIHLTHTHSGPSITLNSAESPGGAFIRPYLLSVRQALIEAIQDALKSADKATLAWETGKCSLACDRDQPDPTGPGMVVGCRPHVEADDTLLVGRVSDTKGKTLATLVNYACHPTSLGGENRLISPDFTGAMREVVESATDDAPCLFLNGAAGDLGPRLQYSGDPAVADQNGRQLGFAALSTLQGMFPPNQSLAFDRVEISGATLGRWVLREDTPGPEMQFDRLNVPLSLNAMPNVEDLEAHLSNYDERTLAERLERSVELRRGFGENSVTDMPVWIWRLGAVAFVATPAEMHSPFQIALRRRFAEQSVVVMNLVNGRFGYLPTKEQFEFETYQVTTSAFEPGSHEAVLAACTKSLQQLFYHSTEFATTPISGPTQFLGRSVNVSSP